MKIDLDKIRRQWEMIYVLLKEVEEQMTEIFNSYNERRRNLYTRAEVMSGRGYSLSDPDDYKMDEYV
jgi:hypothetical protein